MKGSRVASGLLCLALVGGCGPAGLGLGLGELFEDDPVDATDPVVEILSAAGGAPPPSFRLGEQPSFLIRANKRMATTVYVEPEPIVAVPDVNGCPRDARGDLMERFGERLPEAAVRDGAYEHAYPLDLAALGYPVGTPFTRDVRLWVRVVDAQGRIRCSNHRARIDREPPAPPEDVSVEALDAHELVVRWTPSPESDIASYEIRWDVPTDAGGRVLDDLPGTDGGRTAGLDYNHVVDPSAPPPFDEGAARQGPAGIEITDPRAGRATIRGLYALRRHFLQVQAVDEAGNASALDAAREVETRTRAGGDGRFLDPIEIPGLRPHPLTVADFDGDGRLDLAQATTSAGELSVVYALARGPADAPSFAVREAPVASLADPAFPVQGGVQGGLAPPCVAVDVDRDGRPEIVCGLRSTSGGGQIVVADVDRDLTTRERQSLFYGDNWKPLRLVAGDATRDGRPDVVMYGEYDLGDRSVYGGVATLHGDGDGLTKGYTPAGADDSVAVVGRDLALADLDDDGAPDVVLADAGSVLRLLLDDDAAPQGRERSAVGGQPASVAVADVDSDGILDLVVARFDGVLTVLRGTGNDGLADGGFTVLGTVQLGSAPGRVATGDFDADGIVDVAVAGAVPGQVSVLLGTGTGARGDGGFRAVTTVPLGDASFLDLRVVDFDGDGLLDLVAQSTTRAVLLRGRGAIGRGTGTFTEAVVTLDVRPLVDLTPDDRFEGEVLLEAGDVDRDGIVDLVAGASFNGEIGAVVVFPGLGTEGQGDGRFGVAVSYVPRSGDAVQAHALADTDRDGAPDLVTASWSDSRLGLFRGGFRDGHPDGSFVETRGNVFPGTAGDVLAADFDADGFEDFVVASPSPRVLFSRGDGTFDEYVDPSFAPGDRLAVGDFDRDGLPDVASLVPFDFELRVHLGVRGLDGRPARRFTTRTVPLPRAALTLAAADLDADGRTDVVTEGRLAMLVLRADGSSAVFAEPEEYLHGSIRTIVHVRDLDGDGVPDLLADDAVRLGLPDATGRPQGRFEDGELGAPTGFIDETWDSGTNDNRRRVIADFDADGIPDLAVEETGRVRIHLGVGTIVER